ncbi:hypothetical protein BaRGS_00014093 [Batillaria attramentaria]|uniref:Uncharacterized protein n=1 Tax=Batillaria attramentaria TaxID=370345 RepID=A0ABD0L6B2_9CAEN
MHFGLVQQQTAVKPNIPSVLSSFQTNVPRYRYQELNTMKHFSPKKTKRQANQTLLVSFFPLSLKPTSAFTNVDLTKSETLQVEVQGSVVPISPCPLSPDDVKKNQAGPPAWIYRNIFVSICSSI